VPKKRDQGIGLNGTVKEIAAVFIAIQDCRRETLYCAMVCAVKGASGVLKQGGGLRIIILILTQRPPRPTAVPLEPCACRPYMSNLRIEEYNTVFYSYLARFINTVTLNVNMFLSNTGFTRRNTLFIFLWLRPRNT